MAELVLESKTQKGSMEDVRPALDAALKEQFPGGMLKSHWKGEVLELSGPGAKGSIVYEDGRLVGRALLSPPASLMKGVIEQKISAALEKAAG